MNLNLEGYQLSYVVGEESQYCHEILELTNFLINVLEW